MKGAGPRAKLTSLVTRLFARTIASYLSRRRGQMVRLWLKGDVLDIGCGGESSLADLLEEGQRYVGVDIQEDTIRRLKEARPQHQFHCIDVDEKGKLLEAIPSQFDTIALLAVIEHLQDPQRLLGQCWALLRPGGSLAITTPTPRGDRLMRGFKRVLGVRHEEQEGYSPHRTSFTGARLRSLLTSRNEFRVLVYKKFQLGLNQFVVASKLP